MVSIESEKPSTEDHELSNSSQQLKLIDIDDDVKIRIFEYLDMPNLIRVAETSKNLHNAASDVYRRKYGNKELYLYGWYVI